MSEQNGPMEKKAIPTVYAGIQFRSRLEATWAAFFDLCQMKWEYEPAVYEGPGWTPDFLLGADWSILVEVKPVERLEDWAGHECVPYLRKRLQENDRPVLLLGTTPIFHWFREDLGVTILGPVVHGRPDAPMAGCLVASSIDGSVPLEEADITMTLCQGDLGALAQVGAEESAAFSFCLLHAREAWAEAKNRVQWRPPS